MEQVVITFKKIDTIRNICISHYRSGKHPSNNLIQNKNTITAPFYILFPIYKDGLFINSEFYNLSPNDLKAFFVIKNGDYK